MTNMEEKTVLDKGWKLCTPEGDICLEVPHMPMQVLNSGLLEQQSVLLTAKPSL